MITKPLQGPVKGVPGPDQMHVRRPRVSPGARMLVRSYGLIHTAVSVTPFDVQIRRHDFTAAANRAKSGLLGFRAVFGERD